MLFYLRHLYNNLLKVYLKLPGKVELTKVFEVEHLYVLNIYTCKVCVKYSDSVLDISFKINIT